MRQRLLIFFLCMCAASLRSGTISYRLLRTISTPVADELRCIYFDREGMLWMGYESGLRSFDGYQTRTFRSDAYSSIIFPNNTVLCMTEDHDGNLWLGTRDGVVKMNKRTAVFTTYHLSSPADRIIYTMFTSKDGTLWLGTDGGVSRYVKSKDTFYTYQPDRINRVDLQGRKLPAAWFSVKSIAEDRHGNLFLGTWSTGLLRFKPSTNTFVQYPQYNEMNSAYSLFIDSKDRLWIGTWGYGIERLSHPLNVRNPGWKRFSGRGEGFDTYYRIIEDPVSSSIWACCREGVSILDLNDEDEGFGNYRRLSGEWSEDLTFCNDLFTDRRGNIWMGTLEDGVKHVDTRKSLFAFHPINLNANAFPASSVSTVFTHDGRHIWLGLRPYGLALYDTLTHATHINGAIPGMSGIDAQVFRSSLLSIVRRNNGEIWIASGSFGVIVLPPSGNAHVVNTESRSFVFDNYVNTLYAGRDGRVWVGQRSCASVTRRDGSGQRLVLRENGRDFSNCDVRGLMEDRAGNIWLSTENEGIIRYRNGKSHQYKPTNHNYPVYDAINCYEDSKGRLWAISRSGGLFLFDARRDRFEPVNRRFHIEGTCAYAINEDRFGRLWVTTEGALVSLSFTDGMEMPEVVSFSKEDGLPYLVFTPNSTHKYGDKIYFGSRNGFVSFIPRRELISNQRKANLIVTNLFVDDREFYELDSTLRAKITPLTPRYARSLTIPASVSKFSIEFSLLAYANQERNKYSAWLEGYDKDWHYTGDGVHRVTYGNLPSGTYKLHLKGADSYGNWIELPYTIEITVLPPWYLTWWALTIYLLLAAGTVLGFFRWYKGYLNTRHRLQMNSVFTNITHELLTPLMVMSASIDDLRAQAPAFVRNYDIVQNNISRLSRMLRQILEVRKSLAGQLKLKVSHGNLTEFIRKECDNISPLASSKGQKIIVSGAEITGYFDRDKVDKMIYNLLSNALKYSKENGLVKVVLDYREGMAVIQVIDNGIGMSPKKMKNLFTKFFDGDYRRANTEGTGLGLSLTKDIAELHHGTVECESQENVGTTFTLTFPVYKAAFSEDEVENHEKPLDIADMNATPQWSSPVAGDGMSADKEYTILIVEDHAELLVLMERFFAQRYNVMTAKNGQQAMEMVRKHELDVVISDVMMPVMDGIELTRQIKGSADYAYLPVILLTAKTSEEDRTKGYVIGADDYLAKPFKLNDIALRVSNIIDNRERIRKRFRSSEVYDVTDDHLSSPDEEFLQKAINCVREHLTDYDREAFARDMCVSSSTLYNKLRALTGQNITSFMMSVRIKEACRIARQEPNILVSELAVRIGLGTPKYFAKCFKEELGISPSEYLKKIAEKANGTTE